MKRLFIGLVALFLGFGTLAACTQPAEAATVKAVTGPLLNVYENANFGGNYLAQYRATACSTSGASSRQEFPIGWPARVQDSSYEIITTLPYCNVMGVHAFGGTWYTICTMSTRRWYGDYGIGYFGSSPGNWYNDNVDYVMVGYFYGCPLNN